MKSERGKREELIELRFIKIGPVEPVEHLNQTVREKKRKEKKKMLKTKPWTVACFAKATVKML